MTLSSWALLLGLSLLFGCADRLAGGAYIAAAQAWIARALSARPSILGHIVITVANARSTLWAGLLLTAILAAVHLAWAWYGLAWVAWRWDGWTAFGGDMNPTTRAEALGLFERHLFALALVPAAGFAHGDWALAAPLSVVFALYATGWGLILGAEAARVSNLNTLVEFARGLGFGAAVFAIVWTGA